MEIHNNLFSQRKTIRDRVILGLDEIPTTTRETFWHILIEQLINVSFSLSDFERMVLKQKGAGRVGDLLPNYQPLGHTYTTFYEYVLNCNVDDFLDLMELLHIAFSSLSSKYGNNLFEDIDATFKRDGVAYLMDDEGRIQPLTGHKEVITEATTLLYDRKFDGALKEFESAINHFKKRETEDCIDEANKAFESAMKCALGDTKEVRNLKASALIGQLENAGYFTLDSGTKSSFLKVKECLNVPPVLRSKRGVAHGSGSSVVEIPMSVAEFALHTSAACIVFLIRRSEEIA